MGKGYLADTNTIIDYLQTKLPIAAAVLLDSTIQFSVITRIELLVSPNTSVRQLQVLNDFISISNIFALDEQVILKNIEVRKNYRLKLPDAIIAATALVYNLDLLTRNVKDFRKVTGLNCIDPYTM